MLLSESSQPLSQTTVSSAFSQLARSRNATACAAMPAASKVIRTVVVGEQRPLRDAHQAEIGQQANAGAQRQPDQPADREA